jgi:hypothetical protein
MNTEKALAATGQGLLSRSPALVSRAGDLATNSTAQLPAGGVAGPPKYDPVRGRTGALPAETWIRRLRHRISGAGH